MRVLVVEDYPPLRRAISQGLEEAGFAVDTAQDGEDGLWHAQSSEEYDVIVLDLMLPKIDGMTILEKLRASGCETHVLILTARDSLEDRVEGLNRGADDYLVKPFAFAELLARVQALIRRRYDVKSPVLRIGDLEIESTTRTVRRAGSRVDLTSREYSLLEYLAFRRDTVVSRTEIWDHLYDRNATVQSNVVDVYIGYLRKKIDLPGLTPLIQTRRGMGYILTADE